MRVVPVSAFDSQTILHHLHHLHSPTDKHSAMLPSQEIVSSLPQLSQTVIEAEPCQRCTTSTDPRYSDAQTMIAPCKSCYEQARSINAIDFAVEEAMFRRNQDLQGWSEVRWLMERRAFRQCRAQRLRRTGVVRDFLSEGKENTTRRPSISKRGLKKVGGTVSCQDAELGHRSDGICKVSKKWGIGRVRRAKKIATRKRTEV